MRGGGRRLVAASTIALVLGVACQTKRTGGGVRVVMQLDSSLTTADITELRVEVDSPVDAGVSYFKKTFAVPSPLSSFPTSFAVDSNGDPSASVSLLLGVWKGSAPVDERHYQLVDVPADRVTEFDVTFSAQCSPARSPCGSAATCCPTATGVPACSSSIVDGAQPTLTCTTPDGGAAVTDATADAPSDATMTSADAGAALDAPNDAADAGSLDGASDASENAPPGYEGGSPCTPSCTEGVTHCIGGACVAVPPSCAGGGPGTGYNCGGYFGTSDCCGYLDVPLTPQGSFYPGYDGLDYSDMTDRATVSQFSLDVYEVTVGRFRKFVEAAGPIDGGTPWRPQARSGRHVHLASGNGLNAGSNGANVYEPGWDTSWDSFLPTAKADWDAKLTQQCVAATDSGLTAANMGSYGTWTSEADPKNPDNELLPINCVNWYEAYAFCIWDGGFLPSTTEWAFAAAGGMAQRVYAWGDNSPGTSSSYAIYHCYFHAADGLAYLCSGSTNLAAVGQAAMGQSLWGQMDLSGNVYEFTLDLYDGYFSNPCVDCANFMNGDDRVVRGGGFDSDLVLLYNDLQTIIPPANSAFDVGIRCARGPY